MENEKKVDGTSRRKFIKIAAATAYVAPFITSMAAVGTAAAGGSPPSKPKHEGYSTVREYKQGGHTYTKLKKEGVWHQHGYKIKKFKIVKNHEKVVKKFYVAKKPGHRTKYGTYR